MIFGTMIGVQAGRRLLVKPLSSFQYYNALVLFYFINIQMIFFVLRFDVVLQ